MGWFHFCFFRNETDPFWTFGVHPSWPSNVFVHHFFGQLPILILSLGPSLRGSRLFNLHGVGTSYQTLNRPPSGTTFFLKKNSLKRTEQFRSVKKTANKSQHTQQIMTLKFWDKHLSEAAQRPSVASAKASHWGCMALDKSSATARHTARPEPAWTVEWNCDLWDKLKPCGQFFMKLTSLSGMAWIFFAEWLATEQNWVVLFLDIVLAHVKWQEFGVRSTCLHFDNIIKWASVGEAVVSHIPLNCFDSWRDITLFWVGKMVSQIWFKIY